MLPTLHSTWRSWLSANWAGLFHGTLWVVIVILVGMAIEIERKFLVAPDFQIPDGSTGAQLRQAYVTDPDSRVEVRVRAKGSQFLMALKCHDSQSTAMAREEVEFDITAETFHQVWELAAGESVSKFRWDVPLPDGLVATVDVYDGAHLGLRTVEVEFDSVAAAQEFSPPEWFGEDVTGQARYANRLLAAQAGA